MGLSKITQVIVWCIVVAYGVFLLLPMQPLEVVPTTLDGSWKLLLSLAYEKGLIFGRDIHFTYGPLGFLAARSLSESTKGLILAYDIFLAAQLPLVCYFIYRRSSSLTTLALLFCVLYVLAGAMYFLDAPIILFLLSTFWLYEQSDNPRWFKVALATLNAVLALYIKTNLGLAAVAQILGISLFQILRHESRGRGVSQLLCLLALLAGSLLIVKVDLVPFVQSSMHFANGYNDSMYLEISDETYLNRALVAVGIAGACVLVSTLVGKRLFLGLSCAGFLFLLFKQAFVRADGHIYVFFDYVFVPIGLLALFTSGMVRRINIVALITLVVAAWWQGGNGSLPNPIARAQLKWGALEAYAASFKQTPSMPPGVERIGEVVKSAVREAPVDQIPSNAAILHYAGLTYAPRPVPQSYASYDRFLDDLNARFVADRGPAYLLISLGCIDQRLCMYDDTQLKLATLEHYDVVGEENSSVLVQRRQTPLRMERRLVTSGTMQLGKPLELPASEGLQVIEFDIDYSPKGKLRRLLYKPHPLRVRVESAGENKTFRAIVPILRGGVITNFDIQEPRYFRAFYERRFLEIPKVKSVSLLSKHPRHYDRSFTYRVYEVTYH